MNISELTERYEKVCEELAYLNASHRAHMMRNSFGTTIEQAIEFYKSLHKIELNIMMKKEEKSQLMQRLCLLNSQSIRDELNGNKCQILKTE